MNIAQSSIRKNYYFIPKKIVKNFAFLGCIGLLYYIGKKWKVFEKYTIRLEEMVSYEEMKKASSNFVGEMLFDNLAKINLSNYFNENVNRSEDLIRKRKENEKMIQIEFGRDLLKRHLDDNNKFEEIQTKFIKNILDSIYNQSNMSSIIFYSNKQEYPHELSSLIKELFTSDEVVLSFCEVLEEFSKKSLSTKELNKSIDIFTDNILEDKRIKESIYNKLESYYSSTLKKNNDKDLTHEDEMKKVNNQLLELINKL